MARPRSSGRGLRLQRRPQGRASRLSSERLPRPAPGGRLRRVWPPGLRRREGGATKSPLADEALRRIASLYEIEAAIRGQTAEDRQLVRQQRTRPLVEAIHGWLRQQLERVSGRSALAKAIRYALNHWSGLIQFLHDGRLELDTNIVERAMRPVALGRKNALFAGSPSGGQHWAIVATLIQSAKLNDVEPLAWLTDVLQRIVSARTKGTELHTLLPWNWKVENPDHVFSSA
jgi:transposase